MKLIIATSNLHKIREYKGIIKPLFPEFDIYSLRDFPSYHPPEETGVTFEENAQIKALHAAQAFNELVLADDSGLVVPALHGEPGIRSARYASDDATDQDNRNKLIGKLKDLQEKERVGYFECTIALATCEKIVKSTRGFCEGYLICEERGGNGFGYDPLFIKYDYNKTFAELDEAIKNRISHRRRAFDKMIPVLESMLSTIAEG
ncbi:MAG: RdgB/HAM1 family non-canonical purine NTP pyrophosphatase [Simkaniaceae bacterium]|nr:RdgB/HAM1 family non-canonical purine NTP pyrophosphatase [Simkaniaceae bacterium]MCF7852143.1 RdgB/HAM1 family non-canonical purine NTP pyrophosphatase [Simkaniaceae bacterium]